MLLCRGHFFAAVFVFNVPLPVQSQLALLGTVDSIAVSYTHLMDAELIPVPGNVRINIKLFETSTGCMTEFNEKGTPLD